MKKTVLFFALALLPPAFCLGGGPDFLDPMTYDTSLEIKNAAEGFRLIMSDDGGDWFYAEEEEGLEAGHSYASLSLKGRDREFYFSLAKKYLGGRIRDRVLGLSPLTAPVKIPIKALSSNFLSVYLGMTSACEEVKCGALNTRSVSFRLLPDGDGDGLLDREEFQKHGAWPGLKDTDSDGLMDGEEVSLGTAAYLADSDGDGLLDGADPHPLVPEYTLSYNDWLGHWSVLTAKFGFTLPYFRLDEEFYASGQSPFYDQSKPLLHFSPAALDLPAEGVSSNYVELTVLAADTVKGLMYFPDNCELIPEKIQFFPEEREGGSLPFLARCGETLRFLVISDNSRPRNGEISVVIDGESADTALPIRYSESLPEIELLFPPNGAKLFSPPVFSWRGIGGGVTNYLLQVIGPESYEASLEAENAELPLTAKGRYLWRVAARGALGETESSLNEFYLLSDDDLDTDGDGASDNDELAAQSDRLDRYDRPLEITCGGLPSGTKGLFYSGTLSALGGARPLSWEIVGAERLGLTAAGNGLIKGEPARAGTFLVTVKVRDRLGRAAEKVLELSVDEEKQTFVRLGAGCFE